MSYRVFIGREADEALGDLPNDAREQVLDRLSFLKSNPRPVGVKKLFGGKNKWRLRVRDWRILYEIDDKAQEVRVYRIRHRSKAY